MFSLNFFIIIYLSDCPNNRWGPGCKKRCHCLGPCNGLTGNCTAGCMPGKMGASCQEGRSGDKKKHKANHLFKINVNLSWKCSEFIWMRNRNACSIKAFPTDCPSTHWGLNCTHRCNCQGPCDHITGICIIGGCTSGKMGLSCQEGRFGDYLIISDQYHNTKLFSNNIERHTAHTIVSWPSLKQWGNSSYFRFDDDNETKYIFSQSSQGRWVNWKYTTPYII